VPEPLIGPLCMSCLHIRKDYTCDAFPEGIPDIIVLGHRHETPVDGDRGIQFEQRPDDSPLPEFDDLWDEIPADQIER